MVDTSNRVALITGAARGIGRAIAIRLAAEGSSVAVNYQSDRENARTVIEAIRQTGGSADAFQADVANATQVEAMVSSIIDKYGRLDVLVNNAGAIVRPGGWNEISESDWQRTLDVNLRGVSTARVRRLRL